MMQISYLVDGGAILRLRRQKKKYKYKVKYKKIKGENKQNRTKKQGSQKIR